MKNKSIVGLNISDFSAEAVWAEIKDGRFEVVSRNRVLIPEGVLINGRVSDYKILGKLIGALFENASPIAISEKKIAFSLSESQVFTHIFSVTESEGNDLRKLIRQEALKTIPIVEDDIAVSYKKLNSVGTQEEQRILLFAASKRVISEWEGFLKKNGLLVERFDVEVLASFRGLDFSETDSPVCLVDMGANTINFSIFQNLDLLHNSQTQYGGNYISEKLARGLKIEIAQAEDLKKNVSLIYEKGDNEAARTVLNNVFAHISEELKRNLEYFREKYPEYGKVAKIIVFGGVAKTKGLLDFLAQQNFGAEILSADKEFSFQNLPLEYLSAAGLARLNLSDKFKKNDPCFFGKEHGRKINFPGFSGKTKNIFLKIKRFNYDFVFKTAAVFVFAFVVVYFLQGAQKKNSLKNPAIDLTEMGNSNEISGQKDFADDNGDGLKADKNVTGNNLSGISGQESVKIKDIGVNLNVREGPGIAFAVIDQAAPGSEFPLTGEDSGWYEIIIGQESRGWVSSEYVDITIK